MALLYSVSALASCSSRSAYTSASAVLMSFRLFCSVTFRASSACPPAPLFSPLAAAYSAKFRAASSLAPAAWFRAFWYRASTPSPARLIAFTFCWYALFRFASVCRRCAAYSSSRYSDRSSTAPPLFHPLSTAALTLPPPPEAPPLEAPPLEAPPP